MYLAVSAAVSRVASWPASHLLMAVLSSASISMFASPATADEAYLCGPDSVIYVSAEDLPRMKTTNACIAAYYGLTVTAADQQQQAVSKTASPARRKADAHAALKPLLEPDTSARSGSVPVRQASLLPPVAAPGTDYRNVRILNATSDSAAVFHHAR